jgi:anti-sigma-K factor RskA
MSELSHQELRELVSMYALGATDAEESTMVESHLEGCADCTEDLRESLEATALLALSVEPVEPPAHLRDAIVRAAGVDRELRGVTSPRRSPSREATARSPLGRRIARLLTPARALAGAALACAVVATGVAVSERGSGTSSELQAALQAPNARVLQLSAASNGSAARVVTVPGRKAVFVGTMVAAPDGRTYQLWAIPAGGKPVSLGLLGGGTVTRSVASVPGAETYAVTIEPAGGSAQPTTTPIMAAHA